MPAQHCEPVITKRDCEAVAVPEGVDVSIPKGTAVTITQALGGSFTVHVWGRMFRIAGTDADALGKDKPVIPELAPEATHEDVEALAWAQMKTCYDPEIPVNIVDLGLVYECRVDESDANTRRIRVKMTLTEPSCGMGDVLAEDVKSRLGLIPTVETVDVDLVFDPPWTPERMSEVARLETGL